MHGTGKLLGLRSGDVRYGAGKVSWLGGKHVTYFRYDELAIGQPLMTVVHKVTRDFVRQYMEATGDNHEWYITDQSPFGQPVASPALATIFSTAVFGHGGIHRPPGDIHAKHEYEMLSPIKVGSTITTTGRVVDKYEKRGRKFVVYTTSSVDDDGVEVVRCKVTMVVPE